MAGLHVPLRPHETEPAVLRHPLGRAGSRSRAAGWASPDNYVSVMPLNTPSFMLKQRKHAFVLIFAQLGTGLQLLICV